MSTRALFAGATAVGGASYRYWRLYITALDSGGSQAGISEVELRATVGGSDLTTSSTPVTANTYVDNGEEGAYPGSATVDGYTGAYGTWLTPSGWPPPHWVRYDLGIITKVSEIAIYPYVSPRDFKVQGSNDDATWTDVKSFSGVAAWTGWQAFNLT